jgi:hypothetical protein
MEHLEESAGKNKKNLNGRKVFGTLSKDSG